MSTASSLAADESEAVSLVTDAHFNEAKDA